MSSGTSSLWALGRRPLLLASKRNQVFAIPTLGTCQALARAPAATTRVRNSNTNAISTSTIITRVSKADAPCWSSGVGGFRTIHRASSPSLASFRRRQACEEILRRMHSVESPVTAARASASATSAAARTAHNPSWATTFTLSKRGMMSNASRKGEGEDEEHSSKGGQQQNGGEQYDDADYEPEPEEKIPLYKMVGGVCILGLVLAAFGATVSELWPSHMAPQSIMSHAHDVFQADPDTANHFGTPLKVYGRDNNRHREGRRNFVEHVDHEDPIDKSKRTRVRFNVEGPNGHGMAYAEVSNKMESGEWVYLCVQDLQTGHVITLHDNRALLMAQAQADSDEEKSAFRKMLGQ